MPIVEHKPTTLTALLDVIEAFQAKTSASWYRGCGDAEHELVPTMYRHKSKTSRDDRQSLEVDIRLKFSQRSVPFVGRSFGNEWDQMFYMQHYGIPTRLLDWSENPFVALYFALSSGQRNKKGEALTDAAIWLSDPISWNRASLNAVSFSGGILDETSSQIKSYRPGSDFSDMYAKPVMMYGTHNSPRIVAQRGVFCLFGQDSKPMEKVALEDNYPENCLQKIVVEKSSVPTFIESLYRKGFVESVIYPDIHGLAPEMKRSFGF